MSAKHKYNFTVKKFKDREYDVDVLSVSSEGQLLVGRCFDRQLHVYSAEGNHVTSFKLLDGHALTDAAWTTRGNIVYTDNTNSKVVLLTQRCKVIAQTKTSCPYRLSISTDDVIYHADGSTGVCQSTDDGVTWSHVFQVADGCECRQVVKVSSDKHTQVFWTVNRFIADGRKWILRVYTVDTRRVRNNITSHDVTLPSHVAVNLRYSRLTYDGKKNMFVTDFDNKAVHMWSVTDRQYVCQLVSFQQPVGGPLCVAVDSRRGHVMYVGQNDGTVGVFDLT